MEEEPILLPTGKRFTVSRWLPPSHEAESDVHTLKGSSSSIEGAQLWSLPPQSSAQICIPWGHTGNPQEPESDWLLGFDPTLTSRGQLEYSKVLGAWSIALGSASSWLPQIQTLMGYGFAPCVPGAGIPVNSKDSPCLAGSVTHRSPQAGTGSCPPGCLTKQNKPSHLPYLGIRGLSGCSGQSRVEDGRGLKLRATN